MPGWKRMAYPRLLVGAKRFPECTGSKRCYGRIRITRNYFMHLVCLSISCVIWLLPISA
jgi:hypothetical protein